MRFGRELNTERDSHRCSIHAALRTSDSAPWHGAVDALAAPSHGSRLADASSKEVLAEG
jgi:hypothetical protein